jgi:excisionase family DNA binding protein
MCRNQINVQSHPEVMDADELATFLGVDRKTVYDYAGRGEIPHRRLGKRLLFSRSAIVSWLGSCKAASREG